MTITHLHSFFDDPESLRRHIIARNTWSYTYKQGDWYPLPVIDETLPRLFVEGNRRLPYVKDLINEACKMPTEYICLTNSDTCFAPSMHSRVVDWSLNFKPTLPIVGNRKDFDLIDHPLTDVEIMNCPSRYPGIDMFIFQKDWWLSIRNDFPDMLLGREGWDACMWQCVKERGGYSIDNLIYHEKHNSTWEQPQNRYTLHGQLYNLTLASEWFRKKHIDARSFGIRDMPSYFEMPLPSQQCTPQGGWRVVYGGIYAAHPYSFEDAVKVAKAKLREAGVEIPANLKELILRQSHGIIGQTVSS